MAVVAVIRGGVGAEHEVSLKTGLTVLRRLEKSLHRPVDLYIDRSGVWHARGVPMHPHRALSGIDVVFNALHGHYGEDGTVQRELERIGVPYTGPRPVAASIAMNKAIAKDMLAAHGIVSPRHILVAVTPDLERTAIELWRTFPQPSIVKPANAGSSVGVTLAKSFQQFFDGLKRAFGHSKDVMVEEYVRGKEATVAVIDNFRGSKLYTLPPVEIVLPKTCDVFDFDTKYSGKADQRCPGGFSRAEVDALESAARTVHERLGLRHYSRSDFIMTPRGPRFLEANALPELTAESTLSRSMDAVGISMDDVLAHVLTLALEKR